MSSTPSRIPVRLGKPDGRTEKSLTNQWDDSSSENSSASVSPDTSTPPDTSTGGSLPSETPRSAFVQPQNQFGTSEDFSALVPVMPLGHTDTNAPLGWTPGQPILYHTWGVPSPTPKTVIASRSNALPELTLEDDEKRGIWRQPAFLVSIILTFLAAIAFGVIFVINATSSDKVVVTDLKMQSGTGNIVLTWSGPNVPYSLYVVDGSAVPTDLSDLVTGREAWIPRSANLYTESSCFVVRAANLSPDKPVTTQADTLEDQGGQTICLGADDAK